MFMTFDMMRSLGYDEYGNNETLLSAVDRECLEKNTWFRASGEVLCKCGVRYYAHPKVQGALWLTRTCQGIVKL